MGGFRFFARTVDKTKTDKKKKCLRFVPYYFFIISRVINVSVLERPMYSNSTLFYCNVLRRLHNR